LDFPLVAPSANRSNHISPTTAQHVLESLGKNAPMILDGGTCTSGVESTILGFDKGQVVLYRHGAISKEEIEEFIGQELIDFVEYKEQGISPGSSKKHYSPKTRLVLVDNIARHWEESQRVGYLVLQKSFEVSPPHVLKELSASANLEQAAAHLYATLHALDHLELDIIVAQRMPNSGLGRTINDRLERAAEG
jgi:L-threonylcarbamoyladenylate synthase